MLVFVTGATGFVGTYVVRALLDRGHTVRALVRPGSEAKLDARGDDRVEVARGDVADAASLTGDINGCDAVVHLVGIIDERPSKGVTFERVHVEGTANMVDAAHAAGIQRFVHMSANGARPSGNSPYQTTKWRAEELVRTGGFDHWVIFRPSILFGDPGPGRPEFATRLLATLVGPFPVLPILGNGRYALQPIHVAAVADAMAQAVDLKAAHERSFCAAGRERLSFNEVVDRIARGAGRRKRPKVHLPMPLARAMVGTAGRAGLLPISPAQFAMLVESNTCDPAAFFETFGVETPPFDAEHLGYLRRPKGKGRRAKGARRP
ncbi:MAG TPA: NAD(P)H-binding protein [Rubricoccaceae bacterium]|nr:NAD(P)H-binding protein [Rubricoccaceae bacterium]